MNETELAYLKAIARAAFRAAGTVPKRLEAAVKLVDYDALSVKGGELVGLDEQIADLQTEWPELFAEPKEPAPVEETDQDEQPPVDESTLPATVRQSLALLRSVDGGAEADELISKQRPATRTATERQCDVLLGRSNPPEAA